MRKTSEGRSRAKGNDVTASSASEITSGRVRFKIKVEIEIRGRVKTKHLPGLKKKGSRKVAKKATFRIGEGEKKR